MNRPLSLLTALPLLVVSASAAGAEWHPVLDDGGQAFPTASKAAHAYLAGHESFLGLKTVDLDVAAELPVGQYRTVRYRQSYHGLPVIGAAAAVRVRPDGRVGLVVLDVERGIGVSPVPTLSADAARELVAARRGALAEPLWGARLAVLPSARGGFLIWQVDVPDDRGGWRYQVDAHDGTARGARPLAIDALGRVYPIGSVSTPVPEDLELIDLDPSTPQHLNGWSGQLKVTNYVSDSQSGYQVEQSLEPSSGEDFLYDPPANPTDPTDAFAQVGVYYQLTRARDFFATTLGLDMSAASWRVTAMANALDGGFPMDNAFFSPMGIGGPYASPNLIAIGQGHSVDYADDSDVVLHEFTHYVSNNAVGYNYGQLWSNEFGLSPFGGAIDEGVSDYFACSENDDSYLGEATLDLYGRELADTSKRCPNDVYGEVHADGELIGSFSWTLRVLFGRAIADQLVWGALTLLTPDTTLGDFATAVRQTADDMVSTGTLTSGDLDSIDAAIAERGLDDCGSVIPLTKDAPRYVNLMGLDFVSQYLAESCHDLRASGVSARSLFHYRVTPEAGDELVRVKVTLSPSGGSIDWGIYVRAGEHVTFDTSNWLPMVKDYDYAVEHLTAKDGEIVIDASSSPPFDPNVDYYVVLVDQNCPAAFTVLKTDAHVPPATGGTGGSGGTDVGGSGGSPASETAGEEDGCGCRTAGSPSSDWGLSALVAAAALALSRRRRR